MRSALFKISISFFLFSCESVQPKSGPEEATLLFKASIYPSFLEGAEATIFKVGSQQKLEFLLREIPRDDRVSDTFYFKTATLSENQFNMIDSGLIQKTFIRNSSEPKGIRDGIHVEFTSIRNADTSYLHLDNPNIKTDSSGYQITKNAIDHFRILLAGSIINDYLDDVESYIDSSKQRIRMTDNRAINKLRKIEYGR